MRGGNPVLAVGVLAVVVAACGDGESPGAAAVEKSRAAATAAQAERPVEREVSAPRGLGRPGRVAAQANIFGAGHREAPAPAGGGPGSMPPVWSLPAGSRRIVTFPAVSGRVNPIVDSVDYNGASGDHLGPTDVTSLGGISGIVHRRNGMFLVGVFLGEGAPSQPAPARLNFTGRERFSSLSPRLGQTFLVGDGRGRAYRVPARATRLYLGFADGYLYQGEPGWYGNNAGHLTVRVRVTGR
jgi:hypothetical protein